ncbi:hypothetical protein ACFQ0T_39225 [Kitasatospora gansuensis]
MIRRLSRLLGAAGATLALALGGLGAGATPAAAAPLPIDQCTTTSGVVLAVDFGHWGGPLLRSCGSIPTTGYALLSQGGWKTTGTGHDGPAFICRIGYSGHQGGKQYPTPDQDKCVLTPPASAYWSYWHADPGQDTWSYSQLGAMSYKPKPGSVDLWIFGGTNIEGTEGRPAFSPDTVRAHNTTPGGTAPSPAPTPPPMAGPRAVRGRDFRRRHRHQVHLRRDHVGRSRCFAARRRRSEPRRPTGCHLVRRCAFAQCHHRPDAHDTRTVRHGEPSDTVPRDHPVDAAPVADAPHSAGSIAPAVIGIGIVVALGVATVVTALRRRRQAE